MRHLLVIPLALLLCGLCLTGCDNAPSDTRSPEKLWKEVCASCHGQDGRGVRHKLGKRIDMRSDEWQKEHTDDEIAETIREGRKDVKRMPAFGKRLSDEQIDGLVKFIRTNFGKTR